VCGSLRENDKPAHYLCGVARALLRIFALPCRDAPLLRRESPEWAREPQGLGDSGESRLLARELEAPRAGGARRSPRTRAPRVRTRAPPRHLRL